MVPARKVLQLPTTGPLAQGPSIHPGPGCVQKGMIATCTYPSGDRLVTCSVSNREPWDAEVLVRTIDRYPVTVTRHRLPVSFSTPNEAMLQALAWAKAAFPLSPTVRDLASPPARLS